MTDRIHLPRLLLPALCLLVAQARANDDFFEKHVRPVLVERCESCHGAEKQKGGLRLDSRAGWQKGGESGTALVPGKPEESRLIKAIRYGDPDLQMPPKHKLTDGEIAALTDWVKQGATDPREGVVAEKKKASIDYAAARQQWAFHKPVPPVVPVVKGVTQALDAFIVKRLSDQGLKPAPLADKLTLIRRATFDLTGLPPTREEVEKFMADTSPKAFEQVVNRLLDSPRYGERWGRHWLDVVRYADSLDSRGSGKEGDILDAWRYRDWVVAAFNKDLPYNEFIVQQLAGDVLSAQQWDADKVVATGMYAIGNWGNGDSDKQKVYTDIVDDQIDVTGRAFMGLTFGCARCHDHKFDPIATADYYGLAGMFFSSHILDKFAAPSAGEKLMRISLQAPADKARREQLTQRLAAIETQLASGLQVFSENARNVAGNPGLVGWTGKGAANPSLTINTTNARVKFSTITLQARALCVHPGPKVPVTAIWRSPVSGKVSVRADLKDADAGCGDGIEWALRHGSQTLAAGVMENGGSVETPTREVEVKTGDLVRLVIGPRASYSCDSTQTDFIITSGTQSWSLRESFLQQPGVMSVEQTHFALCAGDAEQLGGENAARAKLQSERDQVRQQLGDLPQCQGLQEGGIPLTAYEGFHDAHVHIRGRYDRPGDLIQRRLPVLLAGDRQPLVKEGSGRLELARWLASPDHPLTARVMVNRLWQHHFGEGIVRTPNNFGKLGTPPTHPELLDWLALKFIESGWSMKAMHRLIMLSETYRRSVDSGLSAADPGNQFFSHQNRRRLSAEELRDAMLTVAGTLDETHGGPSVRNIQSLRRTLYVTTIRSDRSSFQMLFDGADPNTIVENRNNSIVAPQALWLINHPFALNQARSLNERMQREAGPGTQERLAWLYDQLFHRQPSPQETQMLEQALATGRSQTLDWEQVCHALLCSNEFAYVD